MSNKVRVYELARELGISNKEVIELCNGLGIGVKSHSSSVVGPQADRVRRKAESQGMAKAPAADDVAEAQAPAAAKAAPVSTKKPPPKKAKEAPAPIKPIKSVKPAGSVVSSGGARSAGAPNRIATPPPRMPQAPMAPAARTAAPKKEKPKAQPIRKAAEVKAREEAEVQARKAAAAPPKPPTGPGGKPIPPPPVGKGGKPIPPPPRNRGGAPGGSGGNFRSGGGSRPSGGAGGGFSRGPGGAPGGPGGGFSRGPGGGPGGPPSGGRPGGRGPGGRGPGGRKKKKGKKRRSEQELMPMDLPTFTDEDAPVPEGVVVIERSSSAQDLGPKLNRTTADVVRFLLTNGDMVTATQSLSDEMIEEFAADVGAEIRLVDPGEEQEEELLELLDFEVATPEDDQNAVGRPPVITVMGHVDHGKTKILDYIRSANVVAGESGGITQHIGAYQTDHNGKKITFLDTPGHEAFTAMRARGATATDVVILVVAADDGVMPQTLEALDHAKAAEVPIIVAINKIDREGSDPDRVMAQLGERNLIPEAWGGDTIMCPVSAMTGEGMDTLMDSILLVSEVEDLKANPGGTAAGIVLESHLDIGRGSVATVLVEHGTLSVGDPMVAGASWGRVRALVTDKGESITAAGPSTPVQVLGLSEVASAGDKFIVAPNEKVAAKVADKRAHWQRLASLGRDAAGAASGGAKLEDIFNQIQAGEAATLNLIVKADVNGSLEAVCDSLKKLERDEVKLAFMLRGVGGITENDVQLAAASNATILGFNVRPDRKARDLAAQEKVEIRNYEIIYKLLEDIQNAMLGMLAPEFEEVITGEAEVREIFRVPKIGAIAGCMVQNGVITRGSKVRFLREGKIIWKGDIQSLKRFKEDAKEVAAGFECGIGLSDFQDLKEGDTIETYKVEEIERTLD